MALPLPQARQGRKHCKLNSRPEAQDWWIYQAKSLVYTMQSKSAAHSNWLGNNWRPWWDWSKTDPNIYLTVKEAANEQQPDAVNIVKWTSINVAVLTNVRDALAFSKVCGSGGHWGHFLLITFQVNTISDWRIREASYSRTPIRTSDDYRTGKWK